MSLPNIEEKAVDKCIDYVQRPAMQQRQQRALVLDLLRDIKGVSISEQGRITKSVSATRRATRSKMQEEFMKVETVEVRAKDGGLDNLEGVAGMFGEA